MQQVQTPLNPTAVTPMLLAAAHGRDECVRLLAAHNPAGSALKLWNFVQLCVRDCALLSAAVHACDANGVTPLMMASAHASLPAVEALLQAGARPSIVDAFGRRYS
jgi:ankyrin repeat protein